MISVIVPVIDAREITQECIEHLSAYAMYNDNEIIVIDNGSDEPFADSRVTTLYNKENVGMVESLWQGLNAVKHNIVVYIHNDVLIHQLGWDILVKTAFDIVPNLAVAGFFGAKGVYPDGGRIHPESNMLGRKWGVKWDQHGHLQYWISPAATLDGLCMIFNRDIILKEGLPKLPPHHWYDRIIVLDLIRKGYRCATIGVGHDHASGLTSCKSDKYFNFAKNWCEKNNITIPEENAYDMAIYCEGAKIFQDEWAPKLPLTVDDRFNYTWTK
jgi:glycosyltransferase involved in cell wall biosynthesis